MTDKDKPIWMLTVGELLNLLDEKIEEKVEKIDVTPKKEEFVYGLQGLANILGCSKNHASRLKRTGIFDSAIKQRGRTIIVDKNKAIELFKNNK